MDDDRDAAASAATPRAGKPPRPPPARVRPRSRRPALEVEHVSRWYGNVVAVNDISFALGPGVTGLLGPNGAGKSTLLHLMAGLLAPSAGTVRVKGATPGGDRRCTARSAWSRNAKPFTPT